MVWKYAYDLDKSETLFLYALRSAKKFDERHMSRKRLVTQLNKIRALKVDKQLREHVDELERRINTLVNTEKKVKAQAKKEDIFHRAIVDKINRLDKKLQQYLAHHKQREDRFNKLEQKVYTTLSRDQKIGKLMGQIEAMEVLYRNLKVMGEISPSQLEDVRAKINEMKARLDALQKEETKQEEQPFAEHLPPRGFMAPRTSKKPLQPLQKTQELPPDQRPRGIKIPKPATPYDDLLKGDLEKNKASPPGPAPKPGPAPPPPAEK